MKLSIVIVSWNVRDLLQKCLESIFRYMKDIEFEVIVVDNASRDGSSDMVREKFGQVKLIANQKNMGFARANNQGIGKARGEYILVLNDDTEFIDSGVEKLVKVMDDKNDWSVAGCKLLNGDRSLQESVRRFPGLLDQVLILLKLHHISLFKKYLDNYLAKEFDYTSEQEVDQVMGAFMMIRSDSLDKAGVFDDRFFYWFEEVDLCKRIKDNGMKVVYMPGVEIIHHNGASFKQLNWHKQLIWNHSVQRYWWKHKPRWEWFILWLFQPVSVALAMAGGLFRKK